VEAFQPVCEVQSDKASVEITSRYSGTIQTLHHAKGEMVKVTGEGEGGVGDCLGLAGVRSVGNWVGNGLLRFCTFGLWSSSSSFPPALSITHQRIVPPPSFSTCIRTLTLGGSTPD